MIIQHNIMALNAHRQLGGNNNIVSKNLEKLSSGFRINRAGDDAAGLGISEKMRAQITGLSRAQSNAQDGISLVQTAEGALTEVHSMLNRMVDLSTQSANGTMQADDRQRIQDEMDALTEEITRISKSTNFNGINLLDGSLSGAGSGSSAGNGKLVATVTGDNGVLKTGEIDATAAKGVYTTDLSGMYAGTLATTDKISFTVEYKDANGNAQSKRLEYTASAAHGTDNAIAADIAKAINADEELKKLFAADGTTAAGFKMTAATAGTSGAQFTGIKVEGITGKVNASNVTAKTTTAATDATTKDIIDFTGTTPAAGDKITIGDKTYEFVGVNGDVSGIGKGNIAVNTGANLAGSLDNLVKALNVNGVKSATVDGDGIKIGNLDEIKAPEKTANIVGSSAAFTVSKVEATKDKASFTVGAGAVDAAAQFLEISYIDENGKEQTAKVGYTADTTATDNVTAIAKAINGDKVLSKLFTATGGTGEVSLEAKTAGASGAKLTGIKTTDINSASVGALKTTTPGRDAGQTIAINAGSLASGDTLSVDGKTFEFVTAEQIDKVKNGNIAVLIDPNSNENTAANLNLAAKNNNVKMDYNAANNSFFVSNEASSSSNGGGLTLQIGDTAEAFNKVTVSVEDMSAAGLNIEGIEVDVQGVSSESIATIKSAINKVSTNRSAMGALQNRLEHTINNLSVASENMTAAESRIRDVDMAKEMMNFTKNNVLAQAAQAMLAQANQQPQQVLQLLR